MSAGPSDGFDSAAARLIGVAVGKAAGRRGSLRRRGVSPSCL